MRDDNGKIVGLVGITREINEFMKAQSELANQKHNLESLVERSPTRESSPSSQDHRIQACNKAFEAIFGYSADEAIGRNLDELIVPEKKRAEGKELTSTSFRQKNIHRELVRKRKDGSLVDVEVHAKSIYLDKERLEPLHSMSTSPSGSGQKKLFNASATFFGR